MTTIAAAIMLDGAVIAADRQVSMGPRTMTATGKIVSGLGVAVGVSGDVLLGRWVRRCPPPMHPDGLDEWADALREWCKERGGTLVDEDGDFAGEMLVAYPARLYHVACNGAVVAIAADYHAVGSGSQVALGAMHALRAAHGELGPTSVRAAILAATAHDTGTGHGVEVVPVRPRTLPGAA